jgi:CRISPR/Cas system Type II protein with McrA/HNH and RuvC-like nuclease domain
MPTVTVSRAKNMGRRALYGIVDPDLSKAQINDLWAFFKNRCAYCNVRLEKGKKQAHIDHLLSTSTSGLNHISNRVLSCAKCNEDEKRDRPWREFLREKLSAAVYRKRVAKIQGWQRLHKAETTRLDPRIAIAAQKEIDRFERELMATARRIRSLNPR